MVTVGPLDPLLPLFVLLRLGEIGPILSDKVTDGPIFITFCMLRGIFLRGLFSVDSGMKDRG